jgi:hypothetical protein
MFSSPRFSQTNAALSSKVVDEEITVDSERENWLNTPRQLRKSKVRKIEKNEVNLPKVKTLISFFLIRKLTYCEQAPLRKKLKKQ